MERITQESSPAQEGGGEREQERESLRREGPQETDVWEALSREGSRQTPTQVSACETATLQSSPGLEGVVSSRVIFMCPRAGREQGDPEQPKKQNQINKSELFFNLSHVSSHFLLASLKLP